MPKTSTGTEGPALSILLPLSLISALTFPHCSPTTKISPFFKVPFWISTVATGPLPTSNFASITAPSAGLSGFAFNSNNSD